MHLRQLECYIGLCAAAVLNYFLCDCFIIEVCKPL